MNIDSISENVQTMLENLEVFKQLVREQNSKIDSLRKELEEVRQQIGRDSAEQPEMNWDKSFYQPHQPFPHFPSYCPPMFYPMYSCPQMQPYPHPQMQPDLEDDESSSEQGNPGFERLFTLENLQTALNVLNGLNEKEEETESETDEGEE